MPASWVDINVSDGSTMEGYLTQPEGDGSHPAVVVIQEIWGVNSHIQSVADRLPELGYVGLAPAMFHRSGRMITGLHTEFPLAIERMQQCTDSGIVADATAAVNYLKSQSFVNGKIGIVGFCFGGRVAYLAACTISDLSASVVFYGGNIGVALGDGQTPLEQTGNINCPVLGLFGEGRRQSDPGLRQRDRRRNDSAGEGARVSPVRRSGPRLPLRGAARGLPSRSGAGRLGQGDGLVRRELEVAGFPRHT